MWIPTRWQLYWSSGREKCGVLVLTARTNQVVSGTHVREIQKIARLEIMFCLVQCSTPPALISIEPKSKTPRLVLRNSLRCIPVRVARAARHRPHVTRSLYPAGYMHSRSPRTLRCTDDSIEPHKEVYPCWHCLENRCLFGCILRLFLVSCSASIISLALLVASCHNNNSDGLVATRM